MTRHQRKITATLALLFNRYMVNVVYSKCLYKATYVCSQLHCSYNIIARGLKLVTSSSVSEEEWSNHKDLYVVSIMKSIISIGGGKSQTMGLQPHLILSMLHRILLFTIKSYSCLSICPTWFEYLPSSLFMRNHKYLALL